MTKNTLKIFDVPLKFKKAWRQICAYSFPRNALIDFKKTKNKTTIESLEDIEILRFLELGESVKLIKMSNKSHPVDTRQDLKYVRKVIQKREKRK